MRVDIGVNIIYQSYKRWCASTLLAQHVAKLILISVVKY